MRGDGSRAFIGPYCRYGNYMTEWIEVLFQHALQSFPKGGNPCQCGSSLNGWRSATSLMICWLQHFYTRITKNAVVYAVHPCWDIGLICDVTTVDRTQTEGRLNSSSAERARMELPKFMKRMFVRCCVYLLSIFNCLSPCAMTRDCGDFARLEMVVAVE
jgi:hypothetical protein